MTTETIICGSKSYEHLSLDDIVDSYEKVIRNNMNVPLNNYGTKDSDYQILNTHLILNYRNLKTLLTLYGGYVEHNKIEKFYNYLHNNEFTKVLNYKNNNTHILKSYLNRVNINIVIYKEIRCGLSHMTQLLSQDTHHHLIGFSLSEEDFTKHQINKKGKPVNDNIHDRKTEINIIKELHKKGLVDATLCTLLDKKIPTLDSRIIEPTKESIKLLESIYTKIEII